MPCFGKTAKVDVQSAPAPSTAALVVILPDTSPPR
ncbi:hypothetical protein M7I_6925 [Glarea lozoyensis 74030]|uniref:Uncharacterized protein n=1 Tax=Glarea lozoyensis (strain ATCC 74030 / MF5533) TaxID=1104152 RepID=H0EVW8_GLAL7|nr:hypothetical protein M7I_6925 [Glarea lozoyensis 74030]